MKAPGITVAKAYGVFWDYETSFVVMEENIWETGEPCHVVRGDIPRDELEAAIALYYRTRQEAPGA